MADEGKTLLVIRAKRRRLQAGPETQPPTCSQPNARNPNAEIRDSSSKTEDKQQNTVSKTNENIQRNAASNSKTGDIQEKAVSAVTKAEVTGEVVGMVTHVYDFDGMCDFQYLPLKKREDGTNEDLTPKIIPPDISSALSWFHDDDKVPQQLDDEEIADQVYLPPFSFSRFLHPCPMIGARETVHKHKKITDKKARTDAIALNLRVERKSHTITVSGNEEVFPTEPKAEAMSERYRNPNINALVSGLFEERPLWSRNAIMQLTDIDDGTSKIILPQVAFYILSGPWGRLWCKFGYDPRRDPASAKWQTVMVSMKKHTKIAERNRLRLATMGTFVTGREAPKSVDNPLTSWQYIPGELPPFRQVWYCVCDIQLPIVENILAPFAFQQERNAQLTADGKKSAKQEAMQQAAASTSASSSSSSHSWPSTSTAPRSVLQSATTSGWLSVDVIDKVRREVLDSIQRTVDILNAKEDLTSAQGSLEDDMRLYEKSTDKKNKAEGKKDDDTEDNDDDDDEDNEDELDDGELETD